jgi:aryl-alcohol dehydrogenase-like predicted oxidoreductase
MEKRQLGNTGIKVSLICLGTMTWGEQNTESEGHEQLDYALDNGINFIDTAEIYPVATREKTYGLTEAYIGNWINKRKNRDKFILATKAASRSNWLPWIRNGNAVLDRDNITAALDGSLRRLQTDYVDLYQLHWPDRSTNFFGRLGYTHEEQDDSVPIEETLSVLGDLQKQGKIRHIGISNETPWGTMKFIELAKSKNLPAVVSIQNPYNLLNRTFEIGLAEIAHREQVGLLAYSPMAFGALSGKYLGGSQPEGARLTLFESFTRYSNPNAVKATQRYADLAKSHGLDPAQMALAYVNTRSFLTSNIIGATSMEQLKTDINSVNIVLSPEVLAGIEDIHVQFPNPSP